MRHEATTPEEMMRIVRLAKSWGESYIEVYLRNGTEEIIAGEDLFAVNAELLGFNARSGRLRCINNPTGRHDRSIRFKDVRRIVVYDNSTEDVFGHIPEPDLAPSTF